MQRCAKCEGTLQPADEAFSDRTRALRCDACGGIWLPEPRTAALEDAGRLVALDASRPSSGDARTGICPRGHGLLARARVDDQGFHLDRCPQCGGVWFDAGEWARMANGFALANLDRLWDPAWRRAQRDRLSRERWTEELRGELGDDAAEALFALAERLEGLDPRARLMAVAFLKDRLSK